MTAGNRYKISEIVRADRAMALRIGERAVTVGRLNPAGEVHVRGDRYPARAEFGQLEPNTPVFVVGANEFGVVVRPAGEGEPVVASDDTDRVVSTPAEKADDRAERTFEVIDEAHEQLRTYFQFFLVLPVLCGAVFGAVGYWSADLTGAAVGALTGLAFGVVCLLKLFLAS